MKPDHRDALSFALDRGIAEANKQGTWRFYNATPIPGLSEAWKQALVCEQGFRPEYLDLEKHGYSVVPTFKDEEKTGGAIFFPGRNRKWNQYQISRIWNTLSEDGLLIVAGNKKAGTGSIRKWFNDHVQKTESLSKHHSVVFWADKKQRSELPVPAIEKMTSGFLHAEGMFSADGPDAGSKLLAEHFENRIGGKVADLGAGWGYLSRELLNRSDAVQEIDLFEADYAALNAARKNLVERSESTKFHWIDVTTEFSKRPYDWVIMNPPFHSGRAAEPGIGQRFIEVAASTLPNGGRLLMVANLKLPYERVLEQCFRSFKKLTEKNGFKVLEAVK